MRSTLSLRSLRVRLLLPVLTLVAAAVSSGAPTTTARAEVGVQTQPKTILLPALAQYTKSLAGAFDAIPKERKQKLEKLALFVRSKRAAGETAKLIFICTHNSRRSHMSQLWSTVAAATYGITGVETFSGGVEATAFNPRAVAALERAGFQIQSPGGENPHYRVTYGSNRPPVEAFSKKYDDAANPRDGFGAVMTCSQADKNCPAIQGASLRVAIPYEDPKVADGTAEEASMYDQRARQIATEMFYVFSRVAAAHP